MQPLEGFVQKRSMLHNRIAQAVEFENILHRNEQSRMTNLEVNAVIQDEDDLGESDSNRGNEKLSDSG